MATRTIALGALAGLFLSVLSEPCNAAPADDPSEQQICELLDNGWAEGAAALKLAEARFKDAIDLRSDDSRLYHAYGLVLLKHHRYADAQKQFEAAVKRSATPSLPAWRLCIQLRVLRGEHEPALAELAGWIRAVAEITPGSPDERLREEYVAWSGRIMGFLEKPAASKRIEVRRKELDAEIGELLDAQEKELYARKKADVLKQFGEIIELRDKRRTAAKQQEAKDKQERKSEIAKEKAQAAEAQEKLEMTATQWQDWIEQQLAEFDRQLSGYERDFGRLEADARTLSLSILELEREISELRARRDNALRDSRSTTPRPRTKPSDTKPSGTPAPKPGESKPSDPKPPEPKPADPKPKEKEKEKEKSKSTLTDTPKGASSDRSRDTREAGTIAALLAIVLSAPLTDDRALAVAYQESIDRLSFEVSVLRREYAALDQEAAEVKAGAAAMLAERQAAIARYQRATGQLVKKSEYSKPGKSVWPAKRKPRRSRSPASPRAIAP